MRALLRHLTDFFSFAYYLSRFASCMVSSVPRRHVPVFTPQGLAGGGAARLARERRQRLPARGRGASEAAGETSS